MINKNNTNKCIYILLVNKNKNIFKVGKTTNIRNRLRTYATGIDTHPDIKFIMLIDDPKKVELCIKLFLKDYEYKKGHEIYKINLDLIKNIVFEYNALNNIRNYTNNDSKGTDDAYIIYNDNDKLDSIN
jgi:excinuclease UvrABC nuclease subunit